MLDLVTPRTEPCPWSLCGQSEKQLANHKQSKAHRKMVESLRAEFGDDILDALHEDETEDGEEEEEASATGADQQPVDKPIDGASSADAGEFY